jgi:hypothetical protein
LPEKGKYWHWFFGALFCIRRIKAIILRDGTLRRMLPHRKGKAVSSSPSFLLAIGAFARKQNPLYFSNTLLKNSSFFSGFAHGRRGMMKPYDESCSLAGPPEPPEFS